jgi:WD40 repeat protein
MKALDKERARRYASASELAADVQRHLEDQAVMAGPPNRLYLTRKYLRRHKVTASAAALITVSLVLGIAATTREGFIAGSRQREAETERNRANVRAAEAEQARTSLGIEGERTKSALQDAEHQRDLAGRQTMEANYQRETAERQSYSANLNAADLLLRSDEPLDARRRLLFCPPGLRGWEWRHLFLKTDASLAALASPGYAHPRDGIEYQRQATGIAFRGNRIFRTSETWVLSWDLTTYLPAGRYGPFGIASAMSRDATRLIVKTSADDVKDAFTLKVLDTSSGQTITSIRIAGQLNYASFSPDGSRAVAVNTDGAMTIWGTNGGQVLRAMAAPAGTQGLRQHTDISPDGRRIATGGTDATGRVQVWDISLGTAILTLQGPGGSYARSIQFSPNGSQIAAGYSDGTVNVWDSATGEALHSIVASHIAVNPIAYSADGSRIATISNGAIRVWDVATGAEVASPGSEPHGSYLTFTPDATRLVSGDVTQPLHVWDASDDPATKTLLPAGQPKGVAIDALCFSEDDKILAIGSSEGGFGLWEVKSRRRAHILSGFPTGFRSKAAACSPQGPYLATGSGGTNDGTIRIWDMNSGEPIRAFAGPISGVTVLAYSRDGSRVASGSTDKTVSIWDVKTGRIVRTMTLAHSPVALDFSPDGHHIVSASGEDGEVVFQVWDAATAKLAVEMRVATANRQVAGVKTRPVALAPVAYSPDGKLIAGGYYEQPVSIWDATTGKIVASLPGGSYLSGLSWNHDGTRLAISFARKPVEIWDVTSRELLLGLAAPPGLIWQFLAFSHNGLWLAAGAGDGTVKLWNSASPSSVRQIK